MLKEIIDFIKRPEVISIISLGFALVAILLTLLKDFILPWFNKPVIEIIYEDEKPFVRVVGQKTFHRFRIRNVGKSLATNCRCQIISIYKDNTIYNDFAGFPLNWASRPEFELEPIRAERLSVGQGEMEYFDVALVIGSDKKVYFIKYHKVGIGTAEEIVDYGFYLIELLFSGDNFKPVKISFNLLFEQDLNSKDTVKITNINY